MDRSTDRQTDRQTDRDREIYTNLLKTVMMKNNYVSDVKCITTYASYYTTRS